MKRTVIVSVVMMLLVALAAQAQTTPQPPGPEHKKLGVFVGTWTTEVKIEADSPDKGKTFNGTNVCAWFTGEYQVICDSDSAGFAGKIKTHMIMGYSMEKKQYYGFEITSGGGDPVLMNGRVEGSIWTWEASNTVEGRTFQFRTVEKFASPNECPIKNEYSEDGKNWILTAEGKSTKQ